MSDDGTKLAAVVFDGRLYTFSDGGVIWIDRSTPTGSEIAGNKKWYSIAMSDNGEKLAAVVGGYVAAGRHLYTYSDSGATWTNRSTAADSEIAGDKYWRSIAMSDNGDELAAVAYNGHLYTATNSGADWTDRSE